MRAIKNRLNRPVSVRPLVVLRVGFGLLMLAGTIRFVWKGWIDEFYIRPIFHFTYTGFEWVKPLSQEGMLLLFAAQGLAAIFIAAGFFYRVSIAGFFLLFTYVELLDKTFYLNHYYFISI